MPEEKVYFKLLEITHWFTEGLKTKYSGHKRFLSFEKATEKANNRLKDLKWIYKVDEAKIKTYINYLIEQDFPIAVLKNGIYWIESLEDINYARGQWAGIVSNIAVKLDRLNKQAQSFEDLELIKKDTLFEGI